MTTKEAIRIIERRRDYVARRIAEPDPGRRPTQLDRAEVSALNIALDALWDRYDREFRPRQNRVSETKEEMSHVSDD